MSRFLCQFWVVFSVHSCQLLLLWIVVQLNHFAALVTTWLCKYLFPVLQGDGGAGLSSVVTSVSIACNSFMAT